MAGSDSHDTSSEDRPSEGTTSQDTSSGNRSSAETAAGTDDGQASQPTDDLTKQNELPNRDNADRWDLLWDVTRPQRRRWVGLGLLLACASGLQLLGPVLLARIVDRATNGAVASELTNIALLFLVAAVLMQALSILATRMATVTAWDTTNQIRLDLVRHVLSLDHEFHRSHTPGELIQRVDGDVTSVSDFLSKVLPKMISAAVIVVGTMAVLAITDWRLALGLGLYLAFTTMVMFRTRGKAVDEAANEMSQTAKMYGGIEEHLTASEDLRSNGARDYVMHRFVEDSSGVMFAKVDAERAFVRLWAQVQGSIALGGAVALIVSGVLVSGGSITLGAAFLLFQYVQLLAKPLEEVVDQIEVIQKANGAMLRVAELRATVSSITDRGSTSPADGALSISLDNVSFDYGDDQPVLSDIDLQIGAGRSVGVVGRTGSGKTTFSRLVLRITEATSGVLCLGGVPIADLSVAELRRRVALIPQEVELFAGSVRDNVTLFDDAPTDEEVVEALRSVGLETLADADIHRQLGSGGDGLSAGEAQLLALARVWLRQPDLIVLDEATARVDPQTEARIDEAVAALRQGRTTIVIAHRLSTLQTVDDIVVFEAGHVLEAGERERLANDTTSRFSALLRLAENKSEPSADAPDAVIGVHS